MGLSNMFWNTYKLEELETCESLESTGYLVINLTVLVENSTLQYPKVLHCSLIVHTNRKFDHKT